MVLRCIGISAEAETDRRRENMKKIAAAAKATKKVAEKNEGSKTFTLPLFKECKTCLRFGFEDFDSARPVNQIYVAKSVFGDGVIPESVTLTVGW